MTNVFASASKTAVDVLNRLSGWLLLMAIIWLCWGIARILWLVLAPPQAPNLPVVQLQPRQAPTIDTSTALAIFENPESQSNQQSAKPPPQTRLAGVMLATPNDLSSALIDVDGVVGNYRIGETLQGSTYKLIDVSWDQAIIEDANDNQVVIDMVERMALDQGNMSANSPSGNIGNHRLPKKNSNTTQASSTLNDVSNNKDVVDEQDYIEDTQSNQGSKPLNATSAIDKAVAELKQNPASYLSGMGIMATGDGYQVTDAMPSDLRNRLGLESGDRVMSVNGQGVGSNPAGDADLLAQVKQSGEAVIEVNRGEQNITIRQQF